MKRLIAAILCLCTFGISAYAEPAKIETAAEYELWTQSPSLTCGFTADDVRIYKSIDLDCLDVYQLSEIGENYYLAVCRHERRGVGNKGKSKLTQHYFYTLYATDTGFIILSDGTPMNEYNTGNGLNIACIKDEIDADYYAKNGSEVPYYIINPISKYVYKGDDEYDDYFYISDKGILYSMCENSEYNSEGYPYIKDKILYRGQERYRSGDTTSRVYYMPGTTTLACSTSPILLKNNQTVKGSERRIPLADMTEANGYKLYQEGFTSNFYKKSYIPVPGSDNLYFTHSQESRINETNGSKEYYRQIDMYKLVNNKMEYLKSSEISGYSSNFKCYSLKNLDIDYYIKNELAVPAVLLGNSAVITTDGNVVEFGFDPTVHRYYNIGAYNNRLAVYRSYNGNVIIRERDETNEYYYWQVINEINITRKGKTELSNDLKLKIEYTPAEEMNGYYSRYDRWNAPDFPELSEIKTKEWWGINRMLTNVFPDGRYVEGSWESLGGSVSEIWYNIYNKDSTLRACGPSGYSEGISSEDGQELITYAINNSKFLVTYESIGRRFVREYYRVAVVQESDTGEITGKTQLGEKNITPPDTSDTEIIQPKIDFGQNDLPIGYNIKDNVIDTDKLEADLREQVNAIRLNDIVIVANDEYQSGGQNTGVTLGTFSQYDRTMGNGGLKLYSNGQYFRWYSTNPKNLREGTYNKSYTIGDKTLYVTFKIINPPSNDGSTTVVF